jgi:nucleoside 2-deoxyribosyltransferase
MTRCELCGLPNATVDDLLNADGNNMKCVACGEYTVSGQWRAAKMVDHLDTTDRIRLCGVVRRDTDDHGRCREMIKTDTYKSIMARHDAPSTPLEQMERFLLIAAERATFVGSSSSFESVEALARRIYFDDRQQGALAALFTTLIRVGYIEDKLGSILLRPFFCVLTLEGWRLADSLRATKKRSDSAFVAMWFHRDMETVYDDALEPALRACGYKPYRVDRDEHNNRIDDRIIANIRASSLFVADLTGMRPNVFYEAGFAYGLGIPVLLTCNKSFLGVYVDTAPESENPRLEHATWFDQVSKSAFDLRQYNMLSWDSHATLRVGLEARIRAIGLDRKA